MQHKHHTPDKSHGHAAHSSHASHVTAMRRAFWVCLLLSVPAVLYSETVQDWLPFTMPTFTASAWLPALCGSIIFFYGGSVFIRGAVAELKQRQPGMMTLISLAIITAFAYSIAVTFGFDGMDFWWELATLITIMLLGHWLEMASVNSAQNALQSLAKLLPDTVEVVHNSESHIVTIDQLEQGTIVKVRPGGNIPADGVVTEGSSDVNEAMITGESLPIKKTAGSKVVGGTLNGNGALLIQVTATGQDTVLSGIMRLVSEAQASKSKTQVLADRAAFALTIIALVSAAATAIGWLLIGGHSSSFVIERVVTVLVIACPHALGLAIPLVVAIATTRAAKNGLLIRKQSAFELAHTVQTILFDKTGTLTTGKQELLALISDTYDEKELLQIAASAEQSSEHSIGKAFVMQAKKQGLSLVPSRDFSSFPGKGVRATVNNQKVAIGGPQLLQSENLQPTSSLAHAALQGSKEGKAVIYIIINRSVVGVALIGDALRPESKAAIHELQSLSYIVAMITGDSSAVAKQVGDELGIQHIHAEVLPDSKAAEVRAIQQTGQKIAFVGDGVNDAPALATANMSIAIGAGTDVAIESADAILVSNNPYNIVRLLRLSRSAYKKMRQNIIWATGYNIIAIPLAAGVLMPVGIMISPAVGAILMSVSTIIVALNAQGLRRTKL